MTRYIVAPIKQEPEDFTEPAYDHLQERWPDWEPNEGNPETAIIEAIAQIAAMLGTLASTVLDSIFRWFGASLVGIPPVEAAGAQGISTWTVIDNKGYTIPAGTLVGIRPVGDELYMFEVAQEVIVGAGQTETEAGEVIITAQEEGASSSGIGAPGQELEIIDELDFVVGAILVEPTTGGADPEEDSAYLTRLREELTMMTPRPIVPSDFSVRAKRHAAIERALTLDTTDANAQESARYTLSKPADANQCTLRFQQGNIDQVTATISSNATAGAVEAALEALAAIETADVACTGGPLGTAPIQIDFGGQYANEYVSLKLASGATHTLVNDRAGGWQSNVERAVTVVPVGPEGLSVGALVRTELQTDLENLRELNFIVRTADPTYEAIDVTFTARAYPNAVPAEVEAAAEEAVALFLSPANWGQPPLGETREWFIKRFIYLNDIIGVLEKVEGLDYIETGAVLIEGVAGSYVMSGNAPLPTPGVINGTVLAG